MFTSVVNSIFSAFACTVPKSQHFVTLLDNLFIATYWCATLVTFVIRLNLKQLNTCVNGILCGKCINAQRSTANNESWSIFNIISNIDVGYIAATYDCKFHNDNCFMPAKFGEKK